VNGQVGGGQAEVALEPVVIEWLASRRLMLIDGEPVDSEQTIEVEDPATGERVAEVAAAGPEQIGRAVASARRAFDDGQWRWMAGAARSRLIVAATQVIVGHAEELAQLDALDAGLPISMSRELLTGAVEFMEYTAGFPTRIAGEALAPAGVRGDQVQAQVLREPLGVVAQILPWNTPLSMAIEKIALGLATGNALVVKPAEQTPLSALRLGELLHEVGVPAGVLNIVPGLGSVAGSALVEDPRIDKISFTGSTVTGKRIVAAAAANLTPVSLELGGKSPNVVFADADLEAAVEASAINAFFHSGQACTEPARMLVQRGVYEEFLERLGAAAESFPVGSPFDPGALAGPLVSSQQRERVLGYVESGRNEGAVVAHGGVALDRPGYYVAPTVLTGTTPAMKIEREEVFGPVVSVAPFDAVEEVIARANGTSYGLAAGVWTNDLRIVQRMVRELQAGSVWVNTYNLFDPALPFGGYKQSGWGRESGTAALEQYTRLKAVAIAT
jgi:phenylacetaldehyde dehydrogenase